MKQLIQPEEAFQLIQQHWPKKKTHRVPLLTASNCILSEAIFLDRDQPPFDRVMMDGYALRMEDWNLGIRTFQVSSIQSAGEPAHTLEKTNACIEIMTGAVLPHHCNVVIPYEKSKRVDSSVTFSELNVVPFLNVHQRGTDRKKNECILDEGTCIGPIEIGILAAIGMLNVPVYSTIQIAVVSTGNELVQIHEKPLDHQIRSSNKETLTVLLESHGAHVSHFHLPDSEQCLQEFIQNEMNHFEMVCFTGGVSMGKYDFLPQALANEKAELLFHGIQQKPGKPMLAATLRNTLVLGLPGNPVSVIHCATRYVLPLLNSKVETLVLDQEIQNNSNLVHFKPVKRKDNCAQVINQNGSGDFMGLKGMDGFIEVPANTILTSGAPVTFFSLFPQR
ncbi:MAG: molybdopterin molybdotransferase MoeA [Bacteroidota bacterium]